MRYSAFRKKVEMMPYFRSNIFCHLTDNPALLRRQIVDWKAQGHILEIKRGIYTLKPEDRQVKINQWMLANVIQPVSYISLETALSYYQMIPEQVAQITSVTTRKTQRFETAFGSYVYHHIHHHAYTAFVSLEDENHNTFLMATPEKALLDFFYFRMRSLKKFDINIFDMSFRLQNIKQLQCNKLRLLTSCFEQKKLNDIVELFIRWSMHHD